MTRMFNAGSSRHAPARIAAVLAIATVAALAGVATPATAQPRQDQNWNQDRGPYHRHPGWDNGYYARPDHGYYARPPVVYGSPYSYGYVAPPPVIYNPGIGIYLPGITLGIH